MKNYVDTYEDKEQVSKLLKNKVFIIKGTVRVIFKGTLHAKMAMLPDSERFSWNPYLFNSLEDMVVFLGLKVINSDYSYMFFCSGNAQVTFVEKPGVTVFIFNC